MFGRIASAVGTYLAPRRHALRWVFVGGVVVAVLVGATAGALLLLNGDTAKRAIERQLATLTGGDFHYATLELRAWPRPTAELQRVTFRVAPIVEGTAERMIVRFALLRLLAGEVHVSTILLDRPALVLRPPATGAVSVPDDPVAAYRGAVGPAVEWLVIHARGLALSVRDGTVDIDMPGAATLKLDAVTLDGRVSSDAVEAKLAAHGNLWQGARLQASIATDSLATKAELEIDSLDAASTLARTLDAASAGIHSAATDLKLTLSTDGRRSATGELTFATPTLGVTRNGARLDVGAARGRLTATYAPGDATLRVDELKLGEILPAATGSLKARPGAGGVTFDAALGRVDAGRVRAAALAVAGDVARVVAVSSIVKSGTAVDLQIHAVAERLGDLADVSRYDVAMGVESAGIDIPVPVMTLTGASGRVRIARGVLTASNVAGTFDASSLRDGELVLALAPTVALSSLSVALDLDLAESHGRILRMLRDSPLAREMSRVESISGRAKGTLALRQDGATLRQSYDATGINAKLRYVSVPLPVAIDSGGLHYETGGTLVLRKVAGAIGASRVEEADAEIAFAPGLVVRAGSGRAMLALDELHPWLIALPVLSPFRGEVSALQGAVGVKLARLAGPLAAPGRLQLDAVLTPRTVRVTSPRLPASLTIDGGTIRLQDQDLLFDAVDVALRDVRGTLSGSLRGYATSSPALDVAIARATIGPRGLEWVGDQADVPRGARLLAPIGLERTRVRWPAPAPWRTEVAGAASLPGGARSEFDFSYRSGSVQIRRLTLKDRDSDARATLDWQPERAGLSFHGLVAGQSMARILASPPAASGALRGDFEAAVNLTDALRSRATGKLEGTAVGLPDLFDIPLAIDRITLEADGDRVRVRDTSLRVADQPLQLEGSIARAGDGLLVDGTVTTEAIDARRWLERLPPAADAGGAPRGRWPVRGRIVLRAGHVDVLGYRLEPLVANVSLDARRLAGRRHDRPRLRDRYAVHVDGVWVHARHQRPRERARPAGRRGDRVSHEELDPRDGNDGHHLRFRGEWHAGDIARFGARQRAIALPRWPHRRREYDLGRARARRSERAPARCRARFHPRGHVVSDDRDRRAARAGASASRPRAGGRRRAQPRDAGRDRRRRQEGGADRHRTADRERQCALAPRPDRRPRDRGSHRRHSVQRRRRHRQSAGEPHRPCRGCGCAGEHAAVRRVATRAASRRRQRRPDE
jgi:hypothetical protein